MKLILVVILTFTCAFAYRNPDELINEINAKQSSWRAGRNYYHGNPLTEVSTMPYDISFLENAPRNRLLVHDEDVEIPESFDARTNWPKCKNIGVVTDQGSCAGCWVSNILFS